MNLSPLNTSMVHVSSQPTPASQDPSSDQSSMCFETTQHYHTPLVSPYYSSAPAYTSVRTESPIHSNGQGIHRHIFLLINSSHQSINTNQQKNTFMKLI